MNDIIFLCFICSSFLLFNSHSIANGILLPIPKERFYCIDLKSVCIHTEFCSSFIRITRYELEAACRPHHRRQDMPRISRPRRGNLYYILPKHSFHQLRLKCFPAVYIPAPLTSLKSCCYDIYITCIIQLHFYQCKPHGGRPVQMPDLQNCPTAEYLKNGR